MTSDGVAILAAGSFGNPPCTVHSIESVGWLHLCDTRVDIEGGADNAVIHG